MFFFYSFWIHKFYFFFNYVQIFDFILKIDNIFSYYLEKINGWLYVFALAPALVPTLLAPLKEFVWAPPPNGRWLNELLLLNAWLPNGLIPDPDEDDVPTFPPAPPKFCVEEWLEDEVPWEFGPPHVCVSDPLVDCDVDPSVPWKLDVDWPDALFPLTPFWLNVSDKVCELLSATPNCDCWCAFDALFAWLRSPSGPIVCCVPEVVN